MSRRPRRFLAAGTVLSGVLMVTPVIATHPHVVSVDVPAAMTGTPTYPGVVLLNENNVYAPVFWIAGTPQIGAIQSPSASSANLWALALAVPIELGGAWYEPRDVVLTDGSVFSLFFDGSAEGVPSGARIDSLALDPSGILALSFDIPVTIGGIQYGPADVVFYLAGAFSRGYSGAARGIPAEANLVGLDGSLDGPVLAFDIPVTLEGSYYPVGSLITDQGSSFVLHNLDPAWPAGGQMRDFAFVTGAGSVPGTGSVPLDVTYDQSSSMVTLSWSRSCEPNDADYEVYGGSLTQGLPFAYNHAAFYCSTQGASTVTFIPPIGDSYFLVVPHNGVYEGSYGMASNGAPIPQGNPACRPASAPTCF